MTDVVSATLSGTAAYAWDPTTPARMAVVRDSVVGLAFPRDASQFWLIDFDGSNATPLGTSVLVNGTDTLQVLSMDWSPDGSFIVFSARPSQSFTNRALYRIEVATGAVTNLTTQGGDDDELPTLSPDGSTILFVRNDFLVEGSSFSYWTIPSSGGAATQLTPSTSGLFFSVDDLGFDWSSNGDQIVLTDSDAGTPSVFVIVAATTNPTNYLSTRRQVGRGGARTDVHASWRP